MSARVHDDWVCPRCNQVRGPQFRALSRSDNKTYICGDCGLEEALLSFTGDELTMPNEWAQT